ncbi:MAG: sulfite exporter TauE/SafE family protein [Elainellaceae cyanobacterium]
MIDTPLDGLLLLLFGVLTGTLSGILGIGGGLLLVPALILSGVSATVQATATSLIGVFLSATSGSVRNWRAGALNWKMSLTLAGFGIITAQLGALLGDRLPDRLLSLGFALLLVVTIYLMSLRRRLNQSDERQIEGEAASPYALLPTAGIGLLAGLLSGLFGVGGGVVMVPLQMLILGESIKAAVRSSLGAIVLIAASGLVQHTLRGNVLWVPGLCLGLGGIIGAQYGARLLPKLPGRQVNLAFRALLLAMTVYMVVRTL